jgi:alpha-beta hydrolase superfamily lysophospholipase
MKLVSVGGILLMILFTGCVGETPEEFHEPIAPMFNDTIDTEIKGGDIVEESTIQGEAVSFETEDGVLIKGTLVKAENNDKPVILLLHQLGSNKESYNAFTAYLQAQGFSSLAIDLRGHGASIQQGSATLSLSTFSNQDFQDMLLDIKAAKQYLKKRNDVQFEFIYVVGASIGANLAINSSVGDADVRNIVLLSPGLDYRGLETSITVRGYGKRRMLIVAAKQDSYSFESSETLHRSAQAAKKFIQLDGDAHGTDMLNAELNAQILDWLNQTY